MIVVLRTPSLARRVAAAGGRASEANQRRWHTAAEAAQRQLIARLSVAGLQLRPEFSFSRVLSGFSAPLDARAIALLQRFPEVEGVYPVRIAYPASTTSQLLERDDLPAGSAARARLGLPGYSGHGVTIALLDTGVQHAHDYLAGAVLEGVDILENDDLASARANPDEPSELERHGTQLAGLVVGSGGPGGLTGLAENATLLPIRVAGWQQDLAGRWAVYSRTDQLIAGLERAVDPNGDGNALDAARIAIVGVAEPYAAFADSPAARAVARGARARHARCRTGWERRAGGAPLRQHLRPGRRPGSAHGRSCRRQADDGARPRGDPLGPAGRLRRRGASRRRPRTGRVSQARPRRARPRNELLPSVLGQGAPTLSIADFFDRNGYSRVAGRAVLAPAGGSPDSSRPRAQQGRVPLPSSSTTHGSRQARSARTNGSACPS